MPTQLFFSNNIESLAETFARSIAEQHDWFDPCTVIVPNPYLKKWLQLKIARINGIAINFNFQYLNDGLWGVVKRYDSHSENRVILEPGDLQLMLYHLLNNLDRGNRRVKPLLEYLFNTDGSRRTDYEKKVWQLTSRLARYFLEYEFYREDMIKIWLEGKLLYHSDMEAAQQFLYYSLFRKNGYRDALNKNHVTLPQYWNSISQRINRTPCCKLHLFGKSQLSPFHIRMIYELGKHLDISIYQMNPCSEFWEDVTTPGEDRWQRIRSIPIQENGTGDFLADNADENSLLKQWGKTGRETVKLLSLLEEAGSGELSFISRWIAPESSRTETTCLNTMQSQILKRTTLTGLLNKLSQDASIQIASCPDIFREAETVYNSILYNLERDADLKMTDIAVMVPDMDRYGPVLESVFSGFPRKIAFSIIDSSAAADSLFGKALLSILEIASGLFSRKEVFELINNQCFLTACSMTTDDASTWLSWADALNVFRGFNTEDAIDPGRNLYTWQQGLQRLRLGRIMRTTDLERHNGIFLDFKNIIPYADMETNDQYTIDTFNLTIELLYNRIKDLPVLKTSGLEWLNIIEKLIADFIAIPADRREEYHVLNALLASLKKLPVLDSLNYENRSGAFSFPFIKEFITENLTAIPSIRGSYLNSGINISALVPKRQIPFKIIYIMGMQEGVFPGVSDFSTLNLMNIKRRVGDVTRPDINRYLFLETLLGTREKLYITYVSKDLQKDQDFYPNSVIGQLITYLSNHVTAEAFKIVQVPASGISDAYLLAAFQTGYSDIISSRIDGKFQPVNFSEADRLVLLQTAAKNYTLEPAVTSVITEKLNAKSARLTIPPEKMNDHEKIIPVSLRDLANYLINPVESTLRWHLNIYDEDDENIAQL
jgi:exodeoxyribonuclease V gamma subunit